jgi:hypothetical protein
MIRLFAKVRSERVTKSNSSTDSNQNQANRVPKIPIPDWIEIEGGHQGGFLLIHHFLREGPFIHTWHETVEEAKEEARVELSIGEDEWIETVEAP